MKISLPKLVLLLTPFVIALAFAMDIYVPALPHISKDFSVSANAMQLTLTVFMLTSGLMQLFVGPLSDQHGRKPILMITILIFSTGTWLCSYANNITELTLYRIIQSIGACGMLVIGFAIVRDVFSGDESARAYSYLNRLISFSPMFAPFIGSYLDVHYGWRSTFQALLMITFFSITSVIFGLKETLHKEHRTPLRADILKIYGKIASNKRFLIYTFATCAGLSYLYLFCSISSYIIIRQLHIPEIDYGFYFCFMGISFFIGSFLSGIVVTRIGVNSTLITGFLVTLAGGLIMTLWYLINGLTINGFIWPMLLIGIGGTFCLGAGNGGAMEPFSNNTGAASALGGAARFLFSGLLGSIVIGNHVTSTLPLSLPAIVFSLIGLTLFLSTQLMKNRRH